MGLGVGLHRIERAVETLDAALTIRESQTVALHIYKGEGIALRLSVDHHAIQLAFQRRLRGQLLERNLYRHEWVSLRLFLAFVGQDDDAGWLARMADLPAQEPESAADVWVQPGRYWRDGLDDLNGQAQSNPFRNLPPLAAAVAWLIVTHHHIDHIGLAGWFQERGAELWTSRTAWLMARMGVLDVQERPTPQALAFWRAAVASYPGVRDIVEEDRHDARWNGAVLRFRVG